MAYTHGTVWTDEKVINAIYEVMNALCIERMPSRQEIIKVTKNHKLTNKIAKSGGFSKWAERLALEIKSSETKFGKTYEHNLKKYLECNGYKAEQMTVKHPYDLLINDYIKVDVKAGRRYYYDDKNYYYTFNLEKRNPTCDIYICLCINDEQRIDKILIIPSKFLKLTQLSIGKKSEYDKYNCRWDYLDKFDEFYKKLG